MTHPPIAAPTFVAPPPTRAPAVRGLIVSADDFGFTRSINRGIMEAVEGGAVTAVSMMVSQPGWLDAVQRARAAGSALDIGLHLNLSVGAPLTGISSLTDARTGEFLPVRTLIARSLGGRVRPDDAYKECCAQLDKLLDAGLTVTHLDGHKHLHLLPGVWTGVAVAAAARGGLTVRVPRERRHFGPGPSLRRRLKPTVLKAAGAIAVRRTPPPATPPAFVSTTLYGDNRYGTRLHALLNALPDGTSELMTHPGYVTGPLPGGDSYGAPREAELRALTSSEFRDWLDEADVALTDFGAIGTATPPH
jgi:predicted glycoside hydrolase/deacetylase ChbG (UPF0249 family)